MASVIELTLNGKKPGAGWVPRVEDLAFAQQPGSDMRPYDRLIGAALDGRAAYLAGLDRVVGHALDHLEGVAVEAAVLVNRHPQKLSAGAEVAAFAANPVTLPPAARMIAT